MLVNAAVKTAAIAACLPASVDELASAVRSSAAVVGSKIQVLNCILGQMMLSGVRSSTVGVYIFTSLMDSVTSVAKIVELPY